MPPEFFKRLSTAIVFVVVVLGLALFSDLTRKLLLIVIGTGSLYEYYRMTMKDQKGLALSLSILGLVILVASSYFKLELPVVQGMAIAGSILFAALILNLFVPKTALNSQLAPFTGLIYIVLPVASLLQMGNFFDLQWIILSILILIWISDVAAYMVGSTIGKTKLFERLSPKKTREGFYGAGMTTLIFSYFIASYFTDYETHFWLALGFAIWLFGSLGDLFESQIKRQVGVKDSGSLLPGHGGLLDRFDSFIFCIPFVLLIFLFV